MSKAETLLLTEGECNLRCAFCCAVSSQRYPFLCPSCLYFPVAGNHCGNKNNLLSTHFGDSSIYICRGNTKLSLHTNKQTCYLNLQQYPACFIIVSTHRIKVDNRLFTEIHHLYNKVGPLETATPNPFGKNDPHRDLQRGTSAPPSGQEPTGCL